MTFSVHRISKILNVYRNAYQGPSGVEFIPTNEEREKEG